MRNPNITTTTTTTTTTTALFTTESNSLTRSLPESTLESQHLDSIDPADDAFEDAGEYEEDEDEEDDGEEEDEDEDDEDEDEDVDEDEGVDEVEERESEVVEATTAEQLIERQKLADGFFEVEFIRKKRICKGEPQYLIKWRGWPESANTWEPVDHLQTCPDVIEAYEKSLLSGQKKSSRKRKRKFTQQKKKMQYSYGATKSKIPLLAINNTEHPSSTSLDMSNHDHPQPAMVDVVVKPDEAMKRTRGPKKVDRNGSINVSPASSERDRSESHPGQHANGTSLDTHLQQPIDVEGGLSKSPCVEAGQNNQRRGAQRRKSGSVRRFTQDDSSFNIDCFGTPSLVNASTSGRVEQQIVGNSDASRKKKSEGSQNSSIITKIIKPISYSASVTNNVQDVAVTFVVMRSDGKEVMVDNKFLKATNPHLLINFYEQHLRYNPA